MELEGLKLFCFAFNSINEIHVTQKVDGKKNARKESRN